jgi:hypothetical protein
MSLKEIIRARNRRRRDLKQAIQEREEVVRMYLNVRQEEPMPSHPKQETPLPARGARRLKLYVNE